jgi:hypothetical protein
MFTGLYSVIPQPGQKTSATPFVCFASLHKCRAAAMPHSPTVTFLLVRTGWPSMERAGWLSAGFSILFQRSTVLWRDAPWGGLVAASTRLFSFESRSASFVFRCRARSSVVVFSEKQRNKQ